jgi:hypothetical protein
MHEFDLTGPLLTDVGGTLGFSVLSTPGMIAMMELLVADQASSGRSLHRVAGLP